MKKVFISILLTLLPILASAETIEIDGIWYNLVAKIKEAEVTWNPNIGKGSGSYSGSIEIPAFVTYNDVIYSVTSIGDDAFSYSTNLTSVTIPNSVTSIGESAFYYCNHLPSITIPNSVTSIGGYAFSECSGLTSVHISSLEAWFNISIMSNPLDYAHHLFLNGEEVKDLVIPQSVTSIGRSSFSGCSGLTSITIPNSVTSIGLGAFARCSGLTSITFPNSVTSIDIMAFQGCTGLTSVTIPNSVTSLGEWAFSDCNKLTSVTIGSVVKIIDYRTFANCEELSDVFCLAEKIGIDKWSGEGLYTDPDAFTDSYIEYATLHVPAGSIEAYSSTAPWNGFKEIVALDDTKYKLTYKVDGEEYKEYDMIVGSKITPEAEPTKEGYTFSGWIGLPEYMPAEDVTVTGTFTETPTSNTITIGTAGQATFCSDQPLDFSGVGGINVYIACGFNQENGKLLMVEVQETPAATGLFVKGAKGTYTIPVKATSYYYLNLLKPVFTATIVPETESGYTNYVLGDGVNGVQFYKSANASLAANKAYLQLPTKKAGARTMIEWEIVDDATAIKKILMQTKQQDAIYNLNGQRVTSPRKGIYVKNGQKVFIK